MPPNNLHRLHNQQFFCFFVGGLGDSSKFNHFMMIHGFEVVIEGSEVLAYAFADGTVVVWVLLAIVETFEDAVKAFIFEALAGKEFLLEGWWGNFFYLLPIGIFWRIGADAIIEYFEMMGDFHVFFVGSLTFFPDNSISRREIDQNMIALDTKLKLESWFFATILQIPPFPLLTRKRSTLQRLHLFVALVNDVLCKVLNFGHVFNEFTKIK